MTAHFPGPMAKRPVRVIEGDAAMPAHFAALIRHQLSPEHAAHGWDATPEVVITATEEPRGYSGSVPRFDADISFGTFATDCPCGEQAIRHTDPRLSGQAVLDLVAKITGIQFCGAIGD